MSIIEKLRAETSPEDELFWTWQFRLAYRIAQILEEQNLTQREFAESVGLTDAQVSALLHSSANPTLAVLARIASRLPADLLHWVNSETATKPPAKRSAIAKSRNRKKAL